MAVTNFTTNLGLALPTTGDLAGTWGTTVNTSITELLDTAVAGTTTLSSDADVTLSTTDGAANQARSAILLWTATGTTTRNITAPAHSKAYVVINKTGGTQSIVIRGAGPTTGVTVLAGAQALVAWDGTDFVEIASGYVDGPASATDNAVARFDGTTGKIIQNSVVTIADTTGNMSGVGTLSAGTLNLTNALGVASGGTGLTAGASGGVLGYTATGTLASSVALTANALVLGAGAGATPTPMASLGTTTTVLHGNASGAPTFGAVSLTADVTGTLPTANGGTGLGGGTPFTSGGVVYASSSSALATGSALTFDGANLGVGTTSPSSYARLAVNGSLGILSGAPAYFYNSALTSYASIACVDTNSIAFTNGATEGLRLTSSSLYTASGINVGIGTSSPATKLDVSGGASAVVATLRTTIATGGAAINLIGSSSTYKNWQISAGFAAVFGALEFTPSTAAGGSTFTTPAMLINSSGNVGIGTSSPTSKLTVSGDIEIVGGVATIKNSSGFLQIGTTSNDRLELITNGTLKATLSAAGDLGIGTSSPSGKLHVAGGASNVQFYLSNNSYSSYYYQNTGGTSGVTFPASQAYVWDAGGSERMRIDSAGNVGIGTSSPSEKLSVAGTILATTTSTPAIIARTTSFGMKVFYDDGRTTFTSVNYDGISTNGAQDLYITSGLRAIFGVNSAGTIIYPLEITTAGVLSIPYGQIQFPATQNASANANTLDDYEEGTWTAAFVPSTSGTITLSSATGTYTKVGRIVTINGLFVVSAVSSPLGYFSITGLPFSGGAGASKRCALAINHEDMNTTMTTVLMANIQSGSEIYVFKPNGIGGISLTTAADVKAGTVIFIGGTYTID